MWWNVVCYLAEEPEGDVLEEDVTISRVVSEEGGDMDGACDVGGIAGEDIVGVGEGDGDGS